MAAKLSEKACPRGRKLLARSPMVGKTIRGVVAQIGNIGHINSECFIVKILNL